MIRSIQRDFRLEEWVFEALVEMDQRVLKEAHRACESAYAPHSNFHVGSAVLLENGEIIAGSNQENVAYPSGLCAERVAFFAAGAQRPGIRIVAAAVVTNTDMEITNFSPCGGCRQVMLESEQRQTEPIRFLMQAGTGHVLVSEGVAQFLPLTFKFP